MLTVFVPRRNSRIALEIAGGSGIVGSPDPHDPERIMIDYEGNLYGSGTIAMFADCVHVAAGRHATRYPTVARGYVRAADIVAVGLWDCDEAIVQGYGSGAADCMAGGVIAPRELLATASRYEQRRQWRVLLTSPDPAVRLLAEHHLRHLGP